MLVKITTVFFGSCFLVKDCKIGDIVLTFSGSVFEISEISRNKKRENDLTIAVGVGDIAGSMYGSYEGVFPSLYR
jgi:hypothetical protein